MPRIALIISYPCEINFEIKNLTRQGRIVKAICGGAKGQNLTMRMSMRRFTRLTNAFSKKVENLAHTVSLHFMFYNFGRIYKTLRVTSAMEAGVLDHVWSLEEIAALSD